MIVCVLCVCVCGLYRSVRASVCMSLSLCESVCTCVCVSLFQSLSGSLRLWRVGACVCACGCVCVHRKARDQSQQLKSIHLVAVHLIFKTGTGSLTGLR